MVAILLDYYNEPEQTFLPVALAIFYNSLYNFNMSQISILYRLQQIDSQLDSARNSLQNIERELQDNSIILTAQQKLSIVEQNHRDVTKHLREAEDKSYNTRIKIEVSEASLYGGKIHNPKELQELQNEIASLKRLLITLEDKQLEAMMSVEEAEEKLMWANEEVTEVQGKKIERDAALNGEKTKLIGQIEKLDAERRATIPPIPAPDLGLYEQLRKSRNGVAVVKITSRACSACGTTLTAALIQSAQSTGQLIKCPTCGRILYAG